MKVLLIQSFLGRYEKDGPIFPLGLSYIASSLESNGHTPFVLDMNIYDKCYDVLSDEMLKIQPDIIGISLRNIDTTDKYNHYYYYEELSITLEFIRKLMPITQIIIGGAGFSMFAEKIMERHLEIDFGVYLEGEDTIVELLENIINPQVVKGIFYRNNNSIHYTGDRVYPDFSKSEFPKRHFFNVDSYKMPRNIGIQTMRGCVLKCTYCSYPFLNGKSLRLRSSDDIIAEIEYLKNNFNVEEIIFADSIFDIPKRHAVEICQKIIEKGIKIKWSAWFNIKNFNEEFTELAIKSGCYRMCFSPDGSSNVSLASLKKNISEKDIENILKIAKKYNYIDFRFTIFCSPPMQNFRDIWKTVRFIFLTNLHLPNSKCNVSWARILPHTEIYNLAINENYVSLDTDLLPEKNEFFKKEKLFYVNPKTSYATYIFLSVFFITNKIRKLVKPIRKLLKSNSRKKDNSS